MEMVKTRTIGIEMEGYVEEHPENGMVDEINALNGIVGHDESLSNTYWEDDSDRYGVEVKTKPITNLAEIEPIVKVLHDYGWHVTSSAGTHIHVDISDYTEKDKAKLLRFGKGIERIIFMFIEKYRYDNSYCGMLSKDWRKIFWKNSPVSKAVDLETVRDLADWLDYDYEGNFDLYNSKYHWINIFDSQYGTAEFRLFHAMRSADEIISQANMAYSIVELVKNSSVEQLEFVIKAIYSETTVEGMIEKFFEALDIEVALPVKNQKAYEYLERKLEKQAEKAKKTEQLEAQAI